jgi:hypothetical protein
MEKFTPMIQRLSDRELEVASYIANGDSSKEVARRLGISHNTVEAYKKRIVANWQLTSARRIGQAYMNFIKENRAHILHHQNPPPHNITGYWLSRFHFRSKRSANSTIDGYQFGLELLKPDGMRSFHGQVVNAIRTDEHPAFEHLLHGEVREHHFVGTWENKNSPNFGCFLLRLSSSGMSMSGYYAGTARDGFVRFDRWDWLRVISGDSLQQVDAISFENALNTGGGISLPMTS